MRAYEERTTPGSTAPYFRTGLRHHARPCRNPAITPPPAPGNRHSRVGGNPASFWFPFPASLPGGKGSYRAAGTARPDRDGCPSPPGRGIRNKNQPGRLDSRLRGNDGVGMSKVTVKAGNEAAGVAGAGNVFSQYPGREEKNHPGYASGRIFFPLLTALGNLWLSGKKQVYWEHG